MDNKDKGLKKYAKNSPINTESEEKKIWVRTQNKYRSLPRWKLS